MKKFYLFMLMAVGLLISSSMSAMPERPVPPEPQAPEGVEMVKPNARQILEAPALASTKAPNKVAMGEEPLQAFALYRQKVFIKNYNFEQTDWDALFGTETTEGELHDGDSLVLLNDLTEGLSSIAFFKSIVLDLNGHTICGTEYGIYIECTGAFKVMNGSILSSTYYQKSSTSYYSYGIYIENGKVTLDNVTVNSADEGGAGYAVTIYDGSLVMNNCTVNGYNRGVNVYSNSNNYINVTQTGGSVSGGTYGVLASYATNYTLKSGQVSSFDTQWYYNYINIDGGTVSGKISYGQYYNYVTITSGEILGNIEEKGDYYAGFANELKISGNPIIHGSINAMENVVSLTGGSYAIRPKDSYLGKDYSFGKPVNGFYPLIKAVAQTGGYGFASVEEALADEVFDNTIKLMANVENATINKNTTLDLDIRSITGTLTITDGAKVSVKSFDTGNIHELVATKDDVTLYGGNYDFQPSTKATLAEGLDERADYPSTGKYMVCQAAVASIFRGEGTPEEITYWTLQDAINDAQAGEKILIKKDISILNGVTVAKGKDITIDLNGHVVSGQRNPTGGWQLVNVNGGKLTLMDNTDVNKDGNGKGKLSTANFSSADVSFNPTYAVNLIRNAGTLIIESGLYETFGLGQAAYCVDQYNTGSTTINGGKVISLSSSFAIRIFLPSSLDNKFYINGGIIESLWVQGGEDWDASNTKFTLHIQNATILDRLGIEAVGAEFDILLKNIVMTNHLTLTGDARTAYTAGKYVVDSVQISGYNLSANTGDAAFKHLKNGIYQFEDVYTDAAFTSSNWREKYPEEEGYFAVPHPTEPYVIEIYRTGQANLRAFMPYIVDGYGLVPYINEAEGITAEDKWFEIVPLKGSGEDHSPKKNSEDNMNPDTGLDVNNKPAVKTVTGETVHKDEQGQNVTEDGIVVDDKDLANIWHRTYTWEEDTIPVSGDPVVIDHNVIVEKDSTAEAASIIIEPGQKLIVQEGATLHIEDAGAIFKDETAQLIVEPNAVVTVGSNGIIADDEDNVIVKASETEQGVFMCDPEVKINTKPKATVYLYTKAKQLRGAPKYEYIYQRFAIPTDDGEATIYGDDYTNQELFEGETNYVNAVFAWDKDNIDWKMLARWKDMKPFEGYQVTNNTKNGGITYSFEGNLVGNHNSNFEFAYHPEGFQFFGNSYTAPIYIPTFLDSIQKHNGNEIEYSIWVYDEGDDTFKPVTKVQAEAGLVKDAKDNPITEIRSMQAFIMKGEKGSSTDLSYEGAIWGNPRFENRLPGSAQAPRTTSALDMDIATIIVKAQNGQGDQVLLMQSDNFSDEFENGSDASKYIYAEGINLYANTNSGKLSNVATDNVDGTILAFKSGASSEYTIRFDNLNGEMFTLVDMVTGTQVAMTEGNEYTFSQAPNTDNEVRFMIMGEHKAPTGNESIQINKITKVVENGQFYIVKEGIRYNAVGASFNK